MLSIEQGTGKIIWYNERKGYGFVKFGEDEVFLHHSALDEFGIETVYAGDDIVADVTENGRGAMISNVYAVQRQKAATATDDCELLENEVRGIVKFFNIEKGYGFIDVGQTERDVFVHLRTLRNCGIHNLREGQNLLVVIGDEGKGPQATGVRIIQNSRPSA